MLKKTLFLAAALALIAAACGDDDEPQATPTTAAPTTAAPTTAPPTTTTPPTTEAPDTMDGPTVEVAASDLGDILVDADGNTLYLFQPDNAGPSVCTDACADAWPPLTGGEATAGDGIDAALLGTAQRPDGSVQATYNGWPLYYYFDDQGPGDTNGQGVNDVWWVVSPTGEAITGASEAAAEPSPYG